MTKDQFREELKQKREQEARLTRIKAVFENVLKTSEGRRFVKSVLLMAPVDNNIFNTNQALMSYNEGRRSITSEIRNYIIINFGIDKIHQIENEVI